MAVGVRAKILPAAVILSPCALPSPPAGAQDLSPRPGSGGDARLMMLVHHDDADREFAYGAKSKIGTFSDSLMAEASKQGWVVISMNDDWKEIFSFEP
jgi:hypothetical protein